MAQPNAYAPAIAIPVTARMSAALGGGADDGSLETAPDGVEARLDVARADRRLPSGVVVLTLWELVLRVGIAPTSAELVLVDDVAAEFEVAAAGSHLILKATGC